eukprot:2087946-Amphidinium_carterae.1
MPLSGGGGAGRMEFAAETFGCRSESVTIACLWEASSSNFINLPGWRQVHRPAQKKLVACKLRLAALSTTAEGIWPPRKERMGVGSCS